MSSVPDSHDAPRRGLGRGLDVLIGGAAQPSDLASCRWTRSTPTRASRGAGSTARRSGRWPTSIRQQGVVQPVVVRPRPAGGWELIAGERRWRAAREAGLQTVPAVVRHADDRDSLLLALVENVAREQLSPVEEARAYAVLLDEFVLSLGEVADQVGRSKPSVANRLRLLDLPDDVLGMVERGELTEGHARAVLAVPEDTARARARAADRPAAGCRCAPPSRLRAGPGARQRPRKRAAPVDPALAAGRAPRPRVALGKPAKVGRGKIEIAVRGRARAGRDRRGARAASPPHDAR